MNGRSGITAKGLLKRVLLTLALACGFLLLLAELDAHAAPIRPDIRKIVSEQHAERSAEFTPARAGWDGPEMPVPAASLEPARSVALTERLELLAAAMPDPRAVVAIAAVILLLRVLKTQEGKRAGQFPASSFQFPEEEAAPIGGEEQKAA